MTHEQMIEVIQAAKDGKQIQCKSKYGAAKFVDIDNPAFDFQGCDYRVKPEPREWWVVADGRVLLNAMPNHFGAIKVREVIE